MPNTESTIAAISENLQQLAKERQDLLEQLERINEVFAKLGIDPDRPSRRGAGSSGSRQPGGRRKKGRGLKAGGQRVQGVKQTLLDSLTATPQSPAELADKVSQKLGHKVAITTQLHMLKREKKAKAVGRGQWVKG